MNAHVSVRGGKPVGVMEDLTGIEAASVIYLRLWFTGAREQARVRADFLMALGQEQGDRAARCFGSLCELCVRHGRRPMMRHAVECRCLGSDESCFANFVATAADGEREDALLIATLLVRPDVAPLIASLATDFGLALKRMRFDAAPAFEPPAPRPANSTLH